MRARAPWTFSLLVMGLVLSPLAWPRGRDDFPLSPYPMFTAHRPRVMTLDHVVAIDAAGARSPVAADLIASGGVMQAVSHVSGEVARGTADALCARLAAALRPRSPRPVSLEVVTSTWDMRAYFAGERTPTARTLRARCQVDAP